MGLRAGIWLVAAVAAPVPRTPNVPLPAVKGKSHPKPVASFLLQSSSSPPASAASPHESKVGSRWLSHDGNELGKQRAYLVCVAAAGSEQEHVWGRKLDPGGHLKASAHTHSHCSSSHTLS